MAVEKSNMTVVVHRQFPNYEALTDVTEAVQILYDNLTSTMDWGSGFLDSREIHKIHALAKVCGFEIVPYLYCVHGNSTDTCKKCEAGCYCECR